LISGKHQLLGDALQPTGNVCLPAIHSCAWNISTTWSSWLALLYGDSLLMQLQCIATKLLFGDDNHSALLIIIRSAIFWYKNNI
jgi:hypothetical protein